MEKIRDLLVITERKDADIKILLLDAYSMGFSDGMDRAIEISIETLRENKK